MTVQQQYSTPTANDVYRKIIEISSGYIDPRTPIFINIISREFYANPDMMMPLINQLVDLRLIKYTEKTRESVRLTFLGMNVSR